METPPLAPRPTPPRGIEAVTTVRRSHDASHRAKVARVAHALAILDGTHPVSLQKKAVAHQVPKHGDARRGDTKIDVEDLDRILAIDPETRTCTCEPGVTFEDLVAATLAYDLVPLVVPELRTITVGGAVSGCSLESMSFRVGGFHDTCLAYEVVTTDGQVLDCTATNEHALVFEMMHGSFGTLGVLTKLTFSLVPAKRFVAMTYETYPTLEAYQDAIRRHAHAAWFNPGDETPTQRASGTHRRAVDETSDDTTETTAAEPPPDFMDGIIHAADKYVLCLGRFVDSAPYTHRYDWLGVYWQSTGTRTEDYLTTEDYFFRYDRGVTNVHPKTFLGRLVFGKLVSSDRLLRFADRFHRFLSPTRPTVTLDMFLPSSRFGAFMEWYRRTIDFFPLWCVPYRRVNDYGWIADGYLGGSDPIEDDIFLDVAIYGLEQPEGRNIYAEIEEKLFELRAFKTLISHNFYDEERFWQIWNKPNYDAAKRITDAKNVLRDLYTKMCRTTRGATE